MNAVELLRALERYPVFDVSCFAAVAGLEAGSASVRLHRLKGKGYVHEVRRNTYTVHRDPLIVASNIVWPSYISMWYALAHHGMTEQVPHEITVVTSRRISRDRVRFMGAVIRFVTVDPSLMFGYSKEHIGGKEFFMAEPEKAIIDAVLLGGISMGEVLDILGRNIDIIDIERMVAYIRRSGSGALAKRMGYALERTGHDVHDRIGDLVYPTAIRFDCSIGRDGPVIPRWGVIDNVRPGA